MTLWVGVLIQIFSDGINEDFYDYYKYKGYVLNDDDVTRDDEHIEDTDNNDEEFDPCQCN